MNGISNTHSTILPVYQNCVQKVQTKQKAYQITFKYLKCLAYKSYESIQ